MISNFLFIVFITLIILSIIIFVIKYMLKYSDSFENKYYNFLYFIYFEILAKIKIDLIPYRVVILLLIISIIIDVIINILTNIHIETNNIALWLKNYWWIISGIPIAIWAWIKFWEKQRLKITQLYQHSFLETAKRIDDVENNIETKCCAIKVLGSFVKYNQIDVNKKYIHEQDFLEKFYKQNIFAKNAIDTIFEILRNSNNPRIIKVCKETLGELNHYYDNYNNRIKLKRTLRSNAVYKSLIYKEIENRKENEYRDNHNEANLRPYKEAFLELYRWLFFINNYYVSPIQMHNKDLKDIKDLTGINLRGAGFISSKFNDIDFSESLLEDSRFRSADLIGAKFNKAVLINAEFFEADLNNVEFKEAILINVCLKRVKTLKFIDFEGAIIDNVTFKDFFDNDKKNYWKDVKNKNGTKYSYNKVSREEIIKKKYPYGIEYELEKSENLGIMKKNGNWQD